MDAGQAGRSGDSIGRLLRRTREHYGLDLRQIADQLRIRYVYLDAIERSHFEELPGPTYAVGFVRSYANFLGLDDGEVVRRFKDEVQGIDRTQQLHFPRPVSEAKVPGGAIVLVSLVLIAAAYAGWHVLTSQTASVDDLVPAVPERLKALVGDDAADGADPTDAIGVEATSESARAMAGDVEPQDAGAAEPAGSGPVSAGRADDADDADGATAETVGAGDGGAVSGEPETAEAPAAPAVPDQAGAATADEGVEATAGESAASEEDKPSPTQAEAEAMASVTDTAAPPAIPDGPGGTGQDAADAIPSAPSASVDTAPESAVGRVFGAGNTDSRITLQASEDSWVQVRGPDDSLLLTRVLHPGDSYRVPVREGLVLHTGNAGGLTILVDGEPLASLGETGEVRRGIQLDPARLRQGER